MKFEYFWGEMEVDRNRAGAIESFAFWHEHRGQRYKAAWMEADFTANTGEFHDNYSAEFFEHGKANTIILHHDHGTETWSGLPAWTLEKYFGFLKYLARAQCRSLLADLERDTAGQAPEIVRDEFSARLEAIFPHLETLREQLHKPFNAENIEIFVLLWTLRRYLQTNEQAALDTFFVVFALLEEHWKMERYQPLFEKLLERQF